MEGPEPNDYHKPATCVGPCFKPPSNFCVVDIQNKGPVINYWEGGGGGVKKVGGWGK